MCSKKIKIVCIEDNPGDVFLLRMYLDETPNLDYDLINFERLKSAVCYIDKNTCDLIISDLGLPDSDGIKTFYELQGKYPNLPIIVLTGNNDSKIGIDAVHNGAQDYLVKNEITRSLLSRSILHSLERKQTNLELKEAKDKAEQADNLKSAFLANMSHDLRTPMNSIIGFSELLRSCDTEDQRQDYINIIIRNGEVLLNLLNDIIDISKIEAGQLAIHNSSTDIHEILHDLQKTYLEKIRKKNNSKISFKLNKLQRDESLFVKTDRARLYQIFSNLLDNALKFTDEGIIEYGYDLSEKEISFFVNDTGTGIPENKQQEIFERFGKLNETFEKNLTGTGLGLAISKNLVELLGGKIWVESDIGKGACFYFTIPNNAGSQGSNTVSEVTSKVDADYNWPDKTILIIEDIDSNRQMLEMILKKTNANLISANTGEKGISIIKTEKGIDLVLMDIRLPGINGYETTKVIKKINPGIPVIAQTALAMGDEEKQAYEAGCEAYLTKPIQRQILLKTIAKFIEH